MTTNEANAPAYIAPATFPKYDRTRGTARVDVYTAGELAALGVKTIWESYGHVNGIERFGLSRVVADAAGNLHTYSSDGHKVLIHPADRKLRILTR